MKNWLKKILPVSAEIFYKRMDDNGQMISNVYDKLDQIRTNEEQMIGSLCDQLNKMKAEKDALEERLDAAEAQLLKNDIVKQIQNIDLLIKRTQIDVKVNRKFIKDKSELYDVRFEQNFYRNLFDCDFEKEPDFPERFKRLVSGLEHKSIENVIQMLKRRRVLIESKETKVEMFTLQEQNTIRRIREHFNSNVIQLSESLYYYNDYEKSYILPTNYFSASVFIDCHAIEEIEDLQTIRSGDIIDAGAFIGDSALVLSPLTDGNVYSFEAIPSNYELLLKTIKLNGLCNVIAENYAVSSENKMMQMHVSLSGSSSTAYVRSGAEYIDCIQVQAISIDDYVKQHTLKIGLIKSDVEGAEQDLLKGAWNTIKEQKPVLLISIYHNESDFFDIKPKIEALNLGYKFRIHKPVYGSAIIEAMLVAEVR